MRASPSLTVGATGDVVGWSAAMGCSDGGNVEEPVDAGAVANGVKFWVSVDND